MIAQPDAPKPVRLAIPCQWCRTQEIVTKGGGVACPKCDKIEEMTGKGNE